MKNYPKFITTNFKQTLLTTAAALAVVFFAAPTSKAAPQGGQVVGGTASIAKSGDTTTVDQSTNRAAIDWQSFNVGANETVNFKVPTNGATLNRILNTPGASTISGTVQSNGTLYIINPHGLVFDAGSRVFAQNFVASTATPDPSKFMQGGNVDFVGRNKIYANQTINLNGEIKVTNGGTVGVYAPSITNRGSITALSGNVMLAGVQSHTNAVDENGKMTMVISDLSSSEGGAITIVNRGSIVADGGTISLIAKGDRTIKSINHVLSQIFNTGTLQAKSVGSKTGSIEIVAGNQAGGEGYSRIGGTLDTSAADSTAKAGTITIDSGLGYVNIEKGIGEQDTAEFKASSTKISANSGVYFTVPTNLSGSLTINSSANVSATAKLTAAALTINQDSSGVRDFLILSGRLASLIELSDVETTGNIIINQNASYHFDKDWHASSTLVGIDIGKMSSLNGNITLNQSGSLSVSGAGHNRAVYGIRAGSLAAKYTVVMNQRKHVNSSARVDANGNSNEHNIFVSSVTASNLIEYNVGSSHNRYRQTNLIYRATDGSIEATVESPDDFEIEVADLGSRFFEIVVDTVHGVDVGHWKNTRVEYAGTGYGPSGPPSYWGGGYGTYGSSPWAFNINVPEWVAGIGAYRDLNAYVTELRPIVTPVAPVTPVVPPVVAQPAPTPVPPPTETTPTIDMPIVERVDTKTVAPPPPPEKAPPLYHYPVVPPVVVAEPAPTPVVPPVVAEPAPTPTVPPVVAEPVPTPAVTPIADSPATPVTPNTENRTVPVTPPVTTVTPPAAITPTVVATAPVTPTVVTPGPVSKPSYTVTHIIDKPNFGSTPGGTILDWTTEGITSIVTKTVDGVTTSVSYKGVYVRMDYSAVKVGTIFYEAPIAVYYTQKTGALWTSVITSDGNLIQKTDLVIPTKK